MRGRRHVEVAHIMGTAISVHVVGDVDEDAFTTAASACFAELRAADAVFSPYRDDSDISRMARGELVMADASRWVAEVAQACAEAEVETSGRFSATWAGAFDPTGYVKGWSVERVARAHLAPLLARPGVVAAGINAGGDMQLLTAPDADWTWKVGIVDPADRSRVLAVTSVRNGAIATSGGAERGPHIIDPRSGTPATGAASGTVVSDALSHADAWATAAVVAGVDDLTWIARAGRTSGMIVGPGGRVRRWLEGVEVSVADAATPDQAGRSTFSIGFPFASSSTSLSR